MEPACVHFSEEGKKLDCSQSAEKVWMARGKLVGIV
jgi:hypothetical protein